MKLILEVSISHFSEKRYPLSVKMFRGFVFLLDPVENKAFPRIKRLPFCFSPAA
jgi:hypothetical protein